MRQYVGHKFTEANASEKYMIRYTYSSGNDTSFGVMDSYTYVTHKMTCNMEYMSQELYNALTSHKKINMENIDLSRTFKNYSVIIYYSGDNLKNSSSLSFHSDCIYSPIIRGYIIPANSQVNNTLAVIYLLDNNTQLNQKRRKLGISDAGCMILVDGQYFSTSFILGSDTVTLDNPLDEDPLCSNNIIDKF